MNEGMLTKAAVNLRFSRRLMLTAQVFGTALHVSIWSHTPGDRLWPLISLFVVIALGNALIPLFVRPIVGGERSEDLRALFNVVSHGTIAVLDGWSLQSWLFVPFVVSLASVPPAAYAVRRTLLILVAIVPLALLTGAAPWHVFAFTLISIFVHLIIDAYLMLANNLLRDKDRALQQLAEAQAIAVQSARLASIGEVAAGVAHEVNNPMCFVTFNVSQLLEDLEAGPLDAELRDEYRSAILPETLEGIRRVNSIVDDLRRFARGEIEERVEVDLSDEVRLACRIARTQSKECRFDEDIAPRVSLVGMRRQLGQAVLNLLVNAVQATGGRGTIRVSLAGNDEQVSLAISDDGIGMDEDTRSRLFEPFFTTKPVGAGTGLGLAVVHGVVTAHGGSIDVTSAPGTGTTFAVTFPR